MRRATLLFCLYAMLCAGLPRVARAAWLDAAWGKRIPLTLQSAPDSTMSGVVLLVDAENVSALFADAKPDASDLRVTSGDGETLLPFHLASYDAGASSIELWFRSDAVGPGNTKFYVYYANAAASAASNPAATWSDFDAVYLYETTPGGTLPDVSAHGNDADRVGGSWNASNHVPGKIGKAWNYGNGRTMGVWNKQITDGAEWTVSAWVRATTRSTDFLLQGNPCFFSLHVQASNSSWDTGQYKNDYCPNGNGWSIRSNQLLDLDNWHHHSWSTDAVDSLITYNYDGQRIAYNTQTDRNFPNVSEIPNVKWPAHPVGSTSEGVGIGSVMYANNQDDMDGDVDQFTIRSFQVPAKLLAVEFANQQDPAGFWISGAAQNQPGSPTESKSVGGLKNLFRSGR